MKSLRLYIIMLAMLSLVMEASGMQRTESERLAIAKRILESNDVKAVGSRAVVAPSLRQLASSMDFVGPEVVDPEVEYYVYGYGNGIPGFVIVSADDTMPAVLGYSANSVFASGENTIAMQTVTRSLLANTGIDDSEIGRRILKRIAEAEPKAMEPLLGDIAFGQQDPYYNSVPSLYYGNCNVDGRHMPLGCIPACIAQIMKYYEYPKQMQGDPIDYYTRNFQIHWTWDCANTHFNWENILPNYGIKEYVGSKETASDTNFSLNEFYIDNHNHNYNIVFDYTNHTGISDLHTFQLWICDANGSLIIPASEEVKIQIDPKGEYGIKVQLRVDPALADGAYKLSVCAKTTTYPKWHILPMSGSPYPISMPVEKSGNTCSIGEYQFACRMMYNDAQMYEIEKLTGAVCSALKSDYTLGGAYNIILHDVGTYMNRYFGYDEGMGGSLFRETNYYYQTIAILNELEQKRPVLVYEYTGKHGEAVSWCCVVDGYEKRDGAIYFHLNWGDDSCGNGYYQVQSFMPANANPDSKNWVNEIAFYPGNSGIITGIKPASDESAGCPLSSFSNPIETNKYIYTKGEELSIKYYFMNETDVKFEGGLVAYATGLDAKRYKLGSTQVDGVKSHGYPVYCNDWRCTFPDDMPEGEYIVEIYSLYKGAERLIQNNTVTSFVLLDGTDLKLDKEKAMLTQVGETLKLNVTCTNQNATLEWSSSDTNVCTVDNQGLVTAVGKGACEITVTAVLPNLRLQAICKVGVGIVVSLDKEDIRFEFAGRTIQLNAYCSDPDATYTWNSTNEDICTVSEQGLVTSVGFGECEVKVNISSEYGKWTLSCKVLCDIFDIKIDYSKPWVMHHIGETFKPVFTCTNPYAKLYYASANPEVCTISEEGLITAVGNGKSRITIGATADYPTYHAMTIMPDATVEIWVDEIVFDHETYTCVLGQKYEAQVTCLPEEALNKTVVWESSNPSVVRINRTTGEFECLKEGTVTLTAIATDGSWVRANAKVTVSKSTALTDVDAELRSSDLYNVGGIRQDEMHNGEIIIRKSATGTNEKLILKKR